MSRYTSTNCAGPDRTSPYNETTSKIIAELGAGRVPWIGPWGMVAAKAPLAMPRNPATGRRYSRIYLLILGGAVIERRYPVQSQLTFRQALSLGRDVCKGEPGTTVVHADRFVPEGELQRSRESGEEARAIPFLKRFTIVTAARCENLLDTVAAATPLPPPGLIEPQVETLIRASRVDFCIGGDWAFYTPGPDFVMAPRPQAGFEPINWHRTALHALGHATGHSSYLGRDPSRSFGTKKYAFEEPAAEISAAFCRALHGIVPTMRHADYLGSWLEVVHEDIRGTVRAAAQVSKAADRLLSWLPDPGSARQADPATDNPSSEACPWRRIPLSGMVAP
jgi:antirestriction protein ArdC